MRRRDIDASGVVHEWDDALAGEAMPGGPVVLSWDSAAHAREMNIVIHEFAHKLDMRNRITSYNVCYTKLLRCHRGSG